MEKLQSKPRIHELLDANQKNYHASDDAVPGIHWQPGYVKRFPAAAAASLLFVFFAAVGCALILYFSNDKSTSQWPSTFRPNVAVSLLNALGNLALAAALSSGIPVAWWIKAMEGATISQLHGSWRSSSSMLGLAENLLRLDIIGTAVLVAKISVIDSVLYQRATTTYISQDTPRIVSMLGVAATIFPSTGFVVAEGISAQTQCNCFMIGDEYTSVVNTWQTSNGFFQGYNRYFQECDGVCYTHIDAVGFEIDCDRDINKTDIAAIPIQDFDAAAGAADKSAAWSNIPIFDSSFFVTYANGTSSHQTVIDLNLQYFRSDNPYNPSGAECQGTITTIQCKLRPALVRYPIMITNFTNPHVTNGVSLGGMVDRTTDANNKSTTSNPNVHPYSYDLKQADGFEVLSYLYPNETGELDAITYLGGLANALHIALTSTASITYRGQGTWTLSQMGMLAQTMMFGPPNMGSCDCSFQDESLDAIVAQINQLAFLTSTGMIDQQSIPFSSATSSNSRSALKSVFSAPEPVLAVNASTPLTVRGVASNDTIFFRSLEDTVQISDASFHQTHFLFLGLGLGMTLLCIATTASLFWRYGTLGRTVSMGPIEIAGAFGAPILSIGPVINAFKPTSPAVRPQSPDLTLDDTSLLRSAQTSVNTAAVHNHPRSPCLLQSPTTSITFANMEDLLAAVGDRKVVYGLMDIEDSDHHLAPGHDEGNLLSPLLDTPSSGGPSFTVSKRTSQILTFGHYL